MKQFADIDPLTITQDLRVAANIQYKNKPNKMLYFLIDEDHLIIASVNYFTDFETKESEWLHYQIEFPKKGLIWFLQSLKGKFFKTEDEGGLPKGTFHDKTEIDGERLKLGRAFNADGNGGGGYSFITLDRKESYGIAKEYMFTDEFLFNGGLIQIMQDIAHKIDLGQL